MKAKKSSDCDVFIGNLPFNTSESDVKALFEGVNISRVNVLKNGAAAFITCSSPEEAKEQCKWNGSDYNGRKLRVNLASEKPTTPRREGGGQQDRERAIYVGGLPFGTDDAAIKELFSEDGTVSDVKVLGQGGSAFVTFASAEEAKANLKWNGTKYNGRMLRINMANDKPSF